MIYILTSRKTAALGLGDKSTWAEVIQVPKNLKMPKGNKIQGNGQVYLDISGFSAADLKKAIGMLKKIRAGCFWGIIDPKGAAEDPALFFFEGARDYIGPALMKKGLSKKRFADAEKADSMNSQSVNLQSADKQKSSALSNGKGNLPSGKVKLPAGKFEGWKSMRSGTAMPFFFLFVSVAGVEKTNLRSVVGEAVFLAIKNRLREVLQQGLHEADALLWIETEDNSLFLVPPRVANARAAIESCLKIILNNDIIKPGVRI